MMLIFYITYTFNYIKIVVIICISMSDIEEKTIEVIEEKQENVIEENATIVTEVIDIGKPVNQTITLYDYDENNYDSTNDEKLALILSTSVEVDNKNTVHEFCSEVLLQKFWNNVSGNDILPLETSSKVFKIRTYNCDKEKKKAKEVINRTLSTYYPDKILNFINATVELLYLNNMAEMARDFTCVYKGNFYKVNISSNYRRKIFCKNYYSVKMNLTTVKYIN